MQILYLKSALEDIAWMRRYYTQIFPEGAPRARKQIKKTEAILIVQPLTGRIIDEKLNVRAYVIPKTPFTFLCRISDECIEVLRVLNERGNSDKA